MKKFLTAEWRDLLMANYEVPAELLADRVPSGTVLDLHEGKLFVSLVGFMFLDTKVMGIPIPFHVNFEEVNLRFYVRRETADEIRRGVCFVREIVPRFAIATVARVVYGEPYECWSMDHRRTDSEVEYSWMKGRCSNRFSAVIDEDLGIPSAGSTGEFIIEHYWGYTKRGRNRTDEYRVEHPPWELFSVREPRIDVDFGATYGDEFAFLNNEKPHSVLLAKGSPIAVYKGQKMTG